MLDTQLLELKNKFQAFFDAGLYTGLINTKNRVETGKITSIPASPFLNIQFNTVKREPWATNNIDVVSVIYNLNFIIKPHNQITTDDKLKELSNSLDNFSSIFINEFIKQHKFSGDSYFSALSEGSSDLQLFDKNIFYISNKLILKSYNN